MKRCILLFVLTLLFLCGCVGQAAAEETPAVTAEPTPAPDPKFESGIISGGIYSNTYLKLNFTLPEGWEFLSSEEFQQLLGSGTQQLKDNIELEKAPDGSTFYEFCAHGREGESAIMTVEDLAAHTDGKLLSVQDFIDTLKTQYNAITTVEYEVGDSYEQTLAGHNGLVLPLTVEQAGVYQHNCVFRSGDYMVTITFSAHSDEELKALEAQLKAD